jgi:Domain of unknown function (DUF4386)
MEQNADASPRYLARIAGALYLLNILGGFFAIGVVPAMLVVPGDAAATLENIQANQSLYRLGLAAHLNPLRVVRDRGQAHRVAPGVLQPGRDGR